MTIDDDRNTAPERNKAASDRLPDEALMARVCLRDATALTELYDRYAPAVYALASHALGPADAEEVVQEVFVSLWTKATQYDPARSAFGAWFMAIGRHRILDELRRRGHQQQLGAGDAIEQILMKAADPAASVEDTVVLRESGVAVLYALQRLPAEQRRVLVLGFFGGLSHADMAGRLGWPLGTVKKRVRLGLQKLRVMLAGLAPHENGPARAADRTAPGSDNPANLMMVGPADTPEAPVTPESSAMRATRQPPRNAVAKRAGR